MSDLPYIQLDRNLLNERDGEDFAQFKGEWSPGEDQGWETFTVMLHGDEAGDLTHVTWDDLRQIMEAIDE
jgi:hypothetical protein